MHELSLATALVEQAVEIAQQNDLAAIRSLKISVGEISGVQPEALEFCFPEVARGTLVESATLEIVIVPARIHCSNCHSDSVPDDKWALICQNCNSMNVQIVSGKEFRLIEISGGSSV